jgi:hypothetical protein
MNSNQPQKPTLAWDYYRSEVTAFIAGVVVGATLAQFGQG